VTRLRSTLSTSFLHQAVDLGHGQACLNLAESALEISRKSATPGAAALITVLKARGLAAERHAAQTTTTLQRAETLLSRVAPGTEPSWINRIGFGEPSLAHQTALALRDLGDLAEAEHQFKRSRATRDGVGHPRTYSLTLANLADVQFTRGLLPEACQNWSKSLDAMAGIRSARTDQAVRNLRSRLATLGPRKPTFAQQLNQHAAAWQQTTTSRPA